MTGIVLTGAKGTTKPAAALRIKHHPETKPSPPLRLVGKLLNESQHTSQEGDLAERGTQGAGCQTGSARMTLGKMLSLHHKAAWHQ